jgi:hypothetical protein
MAENKTVTIQPHELPDGFQDFWIKYKEGFQFRNPDTRISKGRFISGLIKKAMNDEKMRKIVEANR